MKKIVLCSLAALALGCGSESKKPVVVTPPANGIATPGAPTTPTTPTTPADEVAATTKKPEEPAATPPNPAPPEPPPPAGDGKDPAKPESPLDVASAAFDDGEPDKGLEALALHHKTNEPTVRSLTLEAIFYEMKGRAVLTSDPKEAIAFLERVNESYKKAETKAGDVGLIPYTKKEWGRANYDLACAYALAGEPEKAVPALEKAYDYGFDNLEKYESDSDLESVRKLPEYEAFTKKAIAAAKEKLLKAIADFEPIDVSFEATAMDGTKISTEALKGKVLVVDCWATWCPPCRKMLPVMVKMHEQYKEKGLEIVGLNFENGEGDEAVASIKEFLESTPLPYPLVVNGSEIRSKLPFFSGIPTCFYVGRDGKIRFRTTGARGAPELETILTTLLDEKPATP